MARLSLTLLGPWAVRLDGEPVTGFTSNKVRALLAYLAVEADRPHSREALAGLLWPAWPESAARASLRNALANLRQAIGDQHAQPRFLDVTHETVQFNCASDCWLDVLEFTALVKADQAGESTGPRLEEAVALYRGAFLEGFSLKDSPTFDDWCLLTRERLHRLALTALHRLAEEYGRRGEFERACECARRQVALEPWQEEAHQQLMRLLARSGQRSAALAQYEICRRTLLAELSVEPAAETTRLYRQIRDGEIGRREISTARWHHLPTPLTPFVGREAELAQIEQHLQDPDCRLLTLVGPGGSGKTRLALEAAAGQVERFGHGVFFVSLAPLRSGDALVPALAQALGFSLRKEGTPRQQLLDYLRQKSMLLILDSFEHLLDRADLVREILSTALEVKVVLTSRARLEVEGERLLPVAGMRLPTSEVLAAFTASPPGEDGRERLDEAAQYDAVALFLSGARRVRLGFALQEDNLADVLRICHLVAGMPLAILLATAWVGMLSPAEIAAEISQHFDFLEAELYDLPARQRSLWAVFEHSWSLLTAREREVFQQLSVFRGGFTRQAAQQVSGASLRTLLALVNRSLLDCTPTGRCGVHELLRQYAAGKLDRSPAAGEAARDRHCACYTAALQRWGVDLKGFRQQAALAEIEADAENARAAWNWAAERGDVERLAQAVEGLCRFYEWRGRYQEGEAACQAAAVRLRATVSRAGPALSQAEGPALSQVEGPIEGLQTLARVLVWQSVFCDGLGRTALADQLARQSLDILDSPELAGQDIRPERAFVLHYRGEMVGGYDRGEARRLFEQSLALYRSLGDRWGTANVLDRLGAVAHNVSNYGEAKRLGEESLALRRALGDHRGIAGSPGRLSAAAGAVGRLEEAERLARECVAIHQQIGDRVSVAFGLGGVASMLLYQGRFGESHSLYAESAALSHDLGMRTHYAMAIRLLGWNKVNLGSYEEAHDLQQTALELFAEAGEQQEIGTSYLGLGELALVRQAYAEARQLLEESVAIYRQIGQRDEEGLALAELGCAVRALGHLAQARRVLCEALLAASETGALAPALFSVAHTALLLADQGQPERAVELYALTSRYPYVGNSRYWEDLAGRRIAAVAAELPPGGIAAAQERGRARDLDATVTELLAELRET